MNPIVRKAMLIAMPLKRSRETMGLKHKNSTSNLNMADSAEHTPAQSSKRQPFTQRSDDADLPDLVADSSGEECAEETNEETASFRVRKCGFRRPRLQWEHVQTWNRDHVSKNDYEGEDARILAKSLEDAKYEVTPKFNARAISDWRYIGYKTVSPFRFLCM
jgi:hypothetical protein